MSEYFIIKRTDCEHCNTMGLEPLPMVNSDGGVMESRKYIPQTQVFRSHCTKCGGCGYTDEQVNADVWLLERLGQLRYGESLDENIIANRRIENPRFEALEDNDE